MASASGYNYHRFARAVLKKARKWEPSLTVQLFKTYWCFEGSQIHFSYDGQMKPFLLALRAQTINGPLLPFLYDIQPPISFVDGCLVVEIQDYRKSPETRTRVVMRPAPETLPQTIEAMLERRGDKWDDHQALELESRIISATSAPLYLGTSILACRNAALSLALTAPAGPNLAADGTARSSHVANGDERSEGETMRKLLGAGTRASGVGVGTSAGGHFQPNWSILRLQERIRQRNAAREQELLARQAGQSGSNNTAAVNGNGEGPTNGGVGGSAGNGEASGSGGAVGGTDGVGSEANGEEKKKNKKKRPAEESVEADKKTKKKKPGATPASAVEEKVKSEEKAEVSASTTGKIGSAKKKTKKEREREKEEAAAAEAAAAAAAAATAAQENGIKKKKKNKDKEKEGEKEDKDKNEKRNNDDKGGERMEKEKGKKKDKGEKAFEKVEVKSVEEEKATEKSKLKKKKKEQQLAISSSAAAGNATPTLPNLAGHAAGGSMGGMVGGMGGMPQQQMVGMNMGLGGGQGMGMPMGMGLQQPGMPGIQGLQGMQGMQQQQQGMNHINQGMLGGIGMGMGMGFGLNPGANGLGAMSMQGMGGAGMMPGLPPPS